MQKNDKTRELLANIFESNVDSFVEIEAREKLVKCIRDIKSQGNGFEELNYQLFVDNIKMKKWKPKAHFFKVFYRELEYAEEVYGITQQESNFLMSLGRYLRWELNLLVDGNNIPMNQSAIIKATGYSKNTVVKYIKSLFKKKMIIPTSMGRDSYYFINPHIMYIGQKISMQIPSLFESIGYIPSKSDNRSNRQKALKKRHEA